MLFRMDGRLIEPGSLDALETARLRLERWDDAHFERFARFMRDPDVIRYIRPDPLEGARATEQHERSLEEWETNGFGKRAMIESATDEWLGFVELSRVGPGKGCRDEDVEIGYFVAPARWGEGIATEAATATRDEAFENAKLDELIGRCRVENVRSARVLQKVGFQLLRHFGLDEGIAVEIHHIQRADWAGPTGRRLRIVDDAVANTGSDYRETG
jgi:RimJ/RimL family protein N-acetyltransferase